MSPQRMPAILDLMRVTKHSVIVAWLVAVAACSPSAAPGPTDRPTPGSPTSGIGGPAIPSATPSPSTASAQSGPPSQSGFATDHPTQPTGEAPVITLNGPFGSVDRKPAVPGLAWPDPSVLERLDTYVRSAPLTIALVDPDLAFAAWTVSTTSAASPGFPGAVAVRPYPESSPELLRITGPSSGDWLLRADVTSTGRAAASYFWHLSVPDRDLPADGRVMVPAPRALLTTAGATVRGVAGSGCYVDTCFDVARTPLVEELERLSGAPGDSLTLTLGDASRFVRWSASVTPIHAATGAGSRTLDRGRDPAGVDHETFRAPGRGDWYVSITITFDRRRGSYTYFTRLTIP